MGIFYLPKHNLNKLASKIVQMLFVGLCNKIISRIFIFNKKTDTKE